MLRQFKNYLFGRLSGVSTEFYNGVGAFSTPAGGGTSITIAAIPADANQAMAVNTLYTGTIAAYTADRTFTLPAVAAVGDEIWIFLDTGDDTFALLLTAAAGDTLNGIAGGTEWSRLFISNEFVRIRCTVANTTWAVVGNGRISQVGLLRLSTDTTSTETANTFTVPTAISGVFTADTDIGNVCIAASSQFKVRRAGRYNIFINGLSVATVTDANLYTVAMSKNGTAVGDHVIRGTIINPATSVSRVSAPAIGITLAAGDTLTFLFASSQGSRGLDSSAAPTVASGMGVEEILS